MIFELNMYRWPGPVAVLPAPFAGAASRSAKRPVSSAPHGRPKAALGGCWAAWSFPSAAAPSPPGCPGCLRGLKGTSRRSDSRSCGQMCAGSDVLSPSFRRCVYLAVAIRLAWVNLRPRFRAKNALTYEPAGSRRQEGKTKSPDRMWVLPQTTTNQTACMRAGPPKRPNVEASTCLLMSSCVRDCASGVVYLR